MQILVALAVAATLGGGAFMVTEAVQSRTEAELREEAGADVEMNTRASSTMEQNSVEAKLIHFFNLDGSGSPESSALDSHVEANVETDASVETEMVEAKTNFSGETHLGL